jgi:peptidyl-prolyl cis-trans isomerase C
MHFNPSFLFQTRRLLWTILLVLTPLLSHASELIYTIQAASYASESDALKYYSLIQQKLQRDELDYLRIEKIGSFYSVRLGKYDDISSSKKFFESIKSRLPSAIRITAYIKKERIVKLYSLEQTSEEQIAREKPLPEPEAENTAPTIDKAANNAAASAHKAKGDRYWETDRHFLAIEEYRQAIKLGLRDPDLYWSLAKILYITGFASDAVSEMEKAVKLKPGLDYFRIELGILYLSEGQLEKAKKQFIAALEINPSLTQMYIYLGELSFRTRNYNTAWFYTKIARQLGYKGKALAGKLQTVSREPSIKPWDHSGDHLFLRQILVDSSDKAESIIKRLDKGELFELVAGTESMGPNALRGGYMGDIRPSDLHPVIVSALKDRQIFEKPVIVETENGFHIIQRIMPFDIRAVEKFLTSAYESGKE